ncbi:hypothetical protein B296_00005460 [Ensete ventricosum]|uniref:Anaphase-promoting complex subunit 4 WD40 domain-containing protein n=1 Tax=Ensete ventricosum TaxID=4639 RepID=A0A426Y0J9_ENSVE|nr:hypothetical protein B296_00005460 [Ensete ventricosum]
MLECFRYPLCPTVQSKVLGGKRRQESAAEGNTRVKYKVMDFPVSLPFQKPAPDKPNPKQGIAWDPTCARLVLCTGTSQLYMWSPSGACCVNIPLSNFVVCDMKWNSDGSCLLLKDRESFCCSAVVSVLPDTSEGSSDGEDV